jgi:hypothetical protein
MVAGRFSFGAFCLVLSFALTREPALPAFAQAAALAICVQALTKRLAQSRASRFTHVERHASERHQN